MSVPTGWLGFLAEVKAKLCHHNVAVVTEGCTLLSRLLLCDVSVRVFIDADVLTVLLDTLIGVCTRKHGTVPGADVSGSSVVPWSDINLASALFKALSDIATHASALVTDIFPSEASTFMSNPSDHLARVAKTDTIHRALLYTLNTVTTVLTSWSVVSVFGRAMEVSILSLLSDLVHVEVKVRGVLETLLECGCDESCDAALARNSPAKQVYRQGVAQFFVEVPGDSQTPRHRLLTSLKNIWSPTPATSKTEEGFIGMDVAKLVEQLSTSRSHQSFIENLSAIDMARMATSMDGTAPKYLLSGADFRLCFSRFFSSSPANQVDSYLLERVLGSLSKMLQESISVSILSEDFIDELLKSTGSLVLMVQNTTPASISTMDGNHVPVAAILSFLVNVEEVATSAQIASMIKNGVLMVAIKYLEPLQTSSSLLHDAPTVTDGALSDEIYLGAALSHAKSADISIGVLVLKLCTSLVSNHSVYLCEFFFQEMIALVARMSPILARILIRFPTMTVRQPDGGRPHPIRTRCCEMPSKSRSTRFAPIGECAAVCLDALVRVGIADEAHTCQILLPFLSGIARATSRSVFPHLRGMHFRLLAHCVTNSSTLLTLVKGMPSAVSAPVSILLSFNGCDDELVSWEISAAAEWVTRVLRITMDPGSHLENFNLLETALPLKLLEISSLATKPHVKSVLLALTQGISKHQVHVSESHPGLRSRLANVLVPQSMTGIGAWEKLLEAYFTLLSDLSVDWGDRSGEGLSSPSNKHVRAPDAPHRLVGVMQNATAQLQCANNILRALSGYYSALKASDNPAQSPLYQLLNHNLMQRVLEAVLDCPTEAVMRSHMAKTMCTDNMHWTPLNRAYEALLQSSCELFSQQYFPADTTAQLPKWPAKMFERISALVRDHTISPATRQCFPILVSSAIHIATPAHPDFLSGIREASGELFTSMLSLPKSRTATASQARLVSLFEEANRCAFDSQWVMLAVENLRSTLRQFKEHRQTSITETQQLEIEGSLTIVASAFAFPDCMLSQQHAHTRDAFAKLLYVLMCGDCGTQWVIVALKLCRSISVSAAGRDILATEINACPGDGANRSCFSKLVQKTVGANLTGRVSAALDEAVTGTARARYNAHTSQEFIIGCECICTVVHRGGEPFAQNLVKLHIVENIGTYLSGMRRQRIRVPTSFIRLLAALSFATCVQPVLFRQLELVTLLLDESSDTTDKGTLALLALRNLCFFQANKVSVCQDGRFVQLFKDALLRRVASSDPAATAPTQAVLQQRALLALSAVTSLCYRSERAKSYIRAALSQPPVITSTFLAGQFGIDAVSTILAGPTKKTAASEQHKDVTSRNNDTNRTAIMGATLDLLQHLGAISVT